GPVGAALQLCVEEAAGSRRFAWWRGHGAVPAGGVRLRGDRPAKERADPVRVERWECRGTARATRHPAFLPSLLSDCRPPRPRLALLGQIIILPLIRPQPDHLPYYLRTIPALRYTNVHEAARIVLRRAPQAP